MTLINIIILEKRLNCNLDTYFVVLHLILRNFITTNINFGIF